MRSRICACLFIFFEICIYLFGCVGSSSRHRDLHCLLCCQRHLVPRPGIEPGPPALGASNLNHWTTREVPRVFACLKVSPYRLLMSLGEQKNKKQ